MTATFTQDQVEFTSLSKVQQMHFVLDGTISLASGRRQPSSISVGFSIQYPVIRGSSTAQCGHFMHIWCKEEKWYGMALLCFAAKSCWWATIFDTLRQCREMEWKFIFMDRSGHRRYLRCVAVLCEWKTATHNVWLVVDHNAELWHTLIRCLWRRWRWKIEKGAVKKDATELVMFPLTFYTEFRIFVIYFSETSSFTIISPNNCKLTSICKSTSLLDCSAVLG